MIDDPEQLCDCPTWDDLMHGHWPACWNFPWELLPDGPEVTEKSQGVGIWAACGWGWRLETE